jgi:hypothetical protein
LVLENPAALAELARRRGESQSSIVGRLVVEALRRERRKRSEHTRQMKG